MLISFNEIQTYNCMKAISLSQKQTHTHTHPYILLLCIQRKKLNKTARGKQFIDVFHSPMRLLLLLLELFSQSLWRGMSAWEVIIWHRSLTRLLSFLLLYSHNRAEKHFSIFRFFLLSVPSCPPSTSPSLCLSAISRFLFHSPFPHW